MSRFPVHTLASVPETVKPRLQLAFDSNGYVSNLVGVLANAPTALETYQTVSVLNANSSLSIAEREVVQLTAATLHGCAFCVAGHTAIAQNKTPLPAASIEALRLNQALEDPRLNTLAIFTTQIIQHRGQVDDLALSTFLLAGFTLENALDVVLGVSLATLCNFANNLAETPLNPELATYRWTKAA